MSLTTKKVMSTRSHITSLPGAGTAYSHKETLIGTDTPPPPPCLPERRKRYTSNREEEGVDARMCPCGTITESRTHIVGECGLCKVERDALDEEMRKLDERDMEEFGRLESSDKHIAILGDRWWPQTAKQDGDRINKRFLRSTWKRCK